MDIVQSDNKPRPKKNPSTYIHNITENLRGNTATFCRLLLMWSYLCVYPAHCPWLGRRPHSLVFVEWHDLLVKLICLILFALAGTHVLHQFNWHSNNLGVVNFKFPFLLLLFQHRFYWMSRVWASERPRYSRDHETQALIDWCLNMNRAVLWSDCLPALLFWDEEDSEETPTKN